MVIFSPAFPKSVQEMCFPGGFIQKRTRKKDFLAVFRENRTGKVISSLVFRKAGQELSFSPQLSQNLRRKGGFLVDFRE